MTFFTDRKLCSSLSKEDLKRNQQHKLKLPLQELPITAASFSSKELISSFRNMVTYYNLWSPGVLVETVSDSSFATFTVVVPHHSYPGLHSYIYAFSIQNFPWVLWAVSSFLFLRPGA